MMSYFRLLAGLTSFTSNRRLSHFSWMGPAGILALSSMFKLLLVDDPGEDGQRERDVDQEDRQRDERRQRPPVGIVARVVPPQRLEQAPEAVIEVQRQRD